MDALPCSALTRASSRAARSSASSQPTSTNASWPRAAPPSPSSQPRRTAGRRMRPAWFCARGMPIPIGEGSGSSATGCSATTAPPLTSTS